ncbi:hypothetical protein [Microbacterium sp. Leaf151]|uniref:hypothetical protein n=1 Tax=Microbacterium sp. Leaf151 TaxID=1736276 RepID=UPI000701F52D|nr:hypothetical protein [Microbacterium sp. Leaf151]KQR20968.1 hypothetical protein ASF76_11745 [Microbacterium sp. Leaf151]
MLSYLFRRCDIVAASTAIAARGIRLRWRSTLLGRIVPTAEISEGPQARTPRDLLAKSIGGVRGRISGVPPERRVRRGGPPPGTEERDDRCEGIIRRTRQAAKDPPTLTELT